ncbi:MAG TPA: hypothetical protein VFL80_01370 [Thermoanaerobaculia bacterium]|nr:hypothetical protein [Thermoanaerobaculia bacterium]
MFTRRLVVGLSVMLLAASAVAVQPRTFIMSSQDHSLTSVSDCDSFPATHVTTLPAIVSAQEHRDVTLGTDDSLRVRTSEEGGLWISGWDKPFARVTVCKYGVGLTSAAAERALSVINVSSRDGQVTADGPEVTSDQVWWAHMIVRVPKNATLDIASLNGGIAIRNVTGRVTARAVNGGISVASSSGDHRLSTEHGGIRLDHVSGRVEATSRTGPISLKLRGLASLPKIFAQTEEGGGIICSSKLCEGARWNDDHTEFRLAGRTSGSIRLFSGTAPIIIEQVR